MAENSIHLITPNAKRVRVAIGILAPYLLIQAALTHGDAIVYWSSVWAVVMALGGVGLALLAIRPMRGLRLAIPQALGCGGPLARAAAIALTSLNHRFPKGIRQGPAFSGALQWVIVSAFVFLACQALAGRAASSAAD